MSSCELLQQVAEARKEVEKLLWGPDVRWDVCKQAKGITVYKTYCVESKSHAFKLEGIIGDATVEEISYRLHPLGPYRTLWDSQLAGLELVEEVAADALIVRHMTKPQLMGLVSARDTIDLSHFRAEEKVRSVVMTGVDHSAVPPQSGIVRAWTYPSGVFLSPATEKSPATKVTTLLHAEMQLPLLPKAIAEAFVPGALIQFFSDLRKSAKIPNRHHERVLNGWP
uniref:START domain-containing protein n=1 Tax=Plectus sambesii TaxID=2011161 RepID=A0A914WQQ7_9BILA